MLNLPRCNPLYENISSSQIMLPEAIQKMETAGFSGYLCYTSSHIECWLIFIDGSLTCAVSIENTRRKSGYEAVISLFQDVISEGGTINLYQTTTNLTACIQALVEGTPVVKPELVSTVDLKATLANMKNLLLNGTVLFSTPEHRAMIFYQNGIPIGFFHDAARVIEQIPTETQRIAALPGALIEIRGILPAHELTCSNLLKTMDVNHLWQTVKTGDTLTQAPAAPESVPEILQTAPTNGGTTEPLLDGIIEDLHEISKAYLGRQGKELIDHLLDTFGGKSALLDSQKTTTFLATVTTQAASIDPESRIEEMVELMRSEIARHLSA